MATSEPIGRLPRGLIVLVTLAAVVVSFAGMKAFAGTLGPAFLALVLVVCVHPIQARLQRRGAPGWVTVIVPLVVVYAILLGLVAALAVSVAQLATLLPEYGPQLTAMVTQFTKWLEGLGAGRDQINAAVDQFDPSSLVGVLQRTVGGVRTVVYDLFFIVVLIFFLSVDAAQFPSRLAVAERVHPHFVAALHSFARGTRRYIVVSTVFGLIVAVIDVGALYLLAIPLPLLWGLLSFITNYIPNVGFVLGMIPPALLGLLEGGLSRMLWVVVAYSVINTVIQSFIQPKVVGDTVGLSVTVTFLSLVFWAFVIGPLGALLAVPLSLLVKALLIDADPDAQWLRPLLGDSTRGQAPDDGETEGRPTPTGGP